MDKDNKIFCDFCNIEKTFVQDKFLITGPTGKHICKSCVERATHLITVTNVTRFNNVISIR